MESAYYSNSQEMGLAGNLLYPNDIAPSQQFYYECHTDYLYTSQEHGTALYNNSNNNNIYDITSSANNFGSASNIQIGSYPPIYAENFQPNSIEGVPFESSVFLSPQTSTSSSAAQSPYVEAKPNSVLDLSLDEIFDVDELFNHELLSEEFLDVLNDVESGDFLKQLEVLQQDKDFENGTLLASNSPNTSNNSSVTSSPKRKYSSDSSDCFSVDSKDSFESCSTISNDNKKIKRARHSKRANHEERASRKKDQNKKAASRYRNKKKTEMQSSEETLEELESRQDNLKEQLKKLQTEFNVILPLAQAAFTFDATRREQLNQLISRINTLI